MSKNDPYASASMAAEQIIKGMGVVSLPIDPKAIARDRGIEVVAKPMGSVGASGMLVRFGNDFAIAYATNLQNEGFENFSVGHELGHYFLPGHVDAVITGDSGSHQSRAGFSSGNRYEAEADRFAASFLMPRHLFYPAIQKAGTGLLAIENLADLCKTSLHATGIRYTQCTREPVAIVISQGSTIDHCFMSAALQNVEGIDWLRKRAAIPRNSATFYFNQVPENVLHAARIEATSNLQDWFGGRRSIEISEDVVGLGRYGRTLTVLHDINVPEPDDEEEEESLIESWTPRFKK
ncbi:ImmA/IrrE family metallo-endopeptidase [Pseudomonas sp. NPDC078416]|uniref:ImmA/IrrE family metallo-endopeptidase n=1 Tax=Pseudomonas sp. NPDC078416 TaxID=3390637 RepID=UPI003D0469D6